MWPGLTYAATDAISQSFPTQSSSIVPGTIVSVVASGGSAVEPATNTGTSLNLVGVAVSLPILELSSGGQHSVQVAINGTAQTLVSDINGTIKAGDKITASPVTGVGMKAVDTGDIIGTAQANLSSASTITRSVTERGGTTDLIKVGLIPVTVSVEYYSNASAGTLSAFVPVILQNLANAVSGKSVSPLRVLVGILVLLLGFGTVVVMLYAAIRSGIISIGRNPLAEKALRKGLLDVILAALGILLISVVIVYAVLAY
jgi:hypothetical protein